MAAAAEDWVWIDRDPPRDSPSGEVRLAMVSSSFRCCFVRGGLVGRVRVSEAKEVRGCVFSCVSFLNAVIRKVDNPAYTHWLVRRSSIGITHSGVLVESWGSSGIQRAHLQTIVDLIVIDKVPFIAIRSNHNIIYAKNCLLCL